MTDQVQPPLGVFVWSPEWTSLRIRERAAILLGTQEIMHPWVYERLIQTMRSGRRRQTMRDLRQALRLRLVDARTRVKTPAVPPPEMLAAKGAP